MRREIEPIRGPDEPTTPAPGTVTYTRPKRLNGAAPWVALIAAIVLGSPKLSGALCAGHAPLHDGDDAELARQALALCRRCPALSECAAWIDAAPKSRLPRGVVAGRLRGHVTSEID